MLGLRHLGDVLPFLPQFYTSDYGREILSDIKTAVNEPEPPVTVQEPSQKLSIELKVPSVAGGRYTSTYYFQGNILRDESENGLSVYK